LESAIKIDHILNKDEYKEEKKMLEQLAFAVEEAKESVREVNELVKEAEELLLTKAQEESLEKLRNKLAYNMQQVIDRLDQIKEIHNN